MCNLKEKKMVGELKGLSLWGTSSFMVNLWLFLGGWIANILLVSLILLNVEHGLIVGFPGNKKLGTNQT